MSIVYRNFKKVYFLFLFIMLLSCNNNIIKLKMNNTETKIYEAMLIAKNKINNFKDKEIKSVCNLIEDRENFVVINISDEWYVLAIDAYDQLSSSWTFTWDELDNLKEKLNWDLVSSNPFIKWSIEMIESFEDKINWSLLSKNINSDSMRDEVFERFAGRWDWKQLSWNSNLCISEKLIEKYKDRWDWKGIIHYFRTSFPAKDFLEKYKDFIPQEIPRRSGLYAQLVYDYKNKLLNKDSDY